MTTFFQDDWAGANGDPWNVSKWTNTGSTGTSLRDIQNNAGRALAQGAAYVHTRAQAVMSAAADFSFTGTFQRSATDEQFQKIMFRGGTVWSAANPDELSDCYEIQFAETAWTFRSVVGDTRATITAGSTTLGTGAWNFRIQCFGTAIKIRWWQGAEPGTWQVDATDSAHASGIVAVSATNGSGGFARSMTFDSFLIQSYVVNTTNLQDSAANVPPQLLSDLESATNGLDWSPVDATLATVAHVGFPTPISVIADKAQRFRVNLYCTAASPTTPAKGKLTLYEAGAAVSPEASIEVDVTAAGGQVVDLNWSGNAVAASADVELRIDGTPGATGGSPVNTVGIKSVEWRVNE